MDSAANFRNAVISEPRVYGPQQPGIQTALGRVPITSTASLTTQQQNVNGPPPIPPRPYSANTQYSPSMLSSPMSMYGNSMYTNSMYGGTYSPYGMSPYGMNRYGGMYGGGGSMYGSGMYGNQMRDPLDPETRFIQLAEESSRPAFQSIESLVMAIGNIASMLDSTFFALTSSFRAILGVAANVGQLRGVFAQFWSTFALIRGVTWLYKKLLYMFGLRKVDPSTERFNEIFSAAASGGGSSGALPAPTADGQPKKVSAWPIITFLGLIFATPYLIMKLIGQVSTTAIEQSRNPQTWVRPYAAEVVYNYKSTAPNELSIYPGQLIQLAPREVQQTHKLLNTGWALATIDNMTSGLVPINYVRRVETKAHQNQANQLPEQQSQSQQQTSMNVPEMQPHAECMKKSPEIESKLDATIGQDWDTRATQLDTTNEIVTNQSNPSAFHIDDEFIAPADLNIL